MLEISELKAKKLPELQEIAKTLNVPKYRSLKKLDLVYQILDYQAANPKKAQEALTEDSNTDSQPKQETKRPRKRTRTIPNTTLKSDVNEQDDKKTASPKKAEPVKAKEVTNTTSEKTEQSKPNKNTRPAKEKKAPEHKKEQPKPSNKNRNNQNHCGFSKVMLLKSNISFLC